MLRTIFCPGCQRRLVLAEDVGNRRVQCPSCQTCFAAESDAAICPSPTAPPPPPIPFVLPADAPASPFEGFARQGPSYARPGMTGPRKSRAVGYVIVAGM